LPFIHLTTFIAAPADRVFDLSRSISVHKASMTRFSELPIAGKTAGLMELGDWVTWQAKHLGKKRTLQVKITLMDKPHRFTDEMEAGDFAMMKHEHYFKPVANGTIMIDQFWFESPYGFFGKMLNKLYLTRYMTGLLEARNRHLKHAAEGGQWKALLSGRGN
jgi:ligand-binding SRPBCC domain-containing protein